MLVFSGGLGLVILYLTFGLAAGVACPEGWCKAYDSSSVVPRCAGVSTPYTNIAVVDEADYTCPDGQTCCLPVCMHECTADVCGNEKMGIGLDWIKVEYDCDKGSNPTKPASTCCVKKCPVECSETCNIALVNGFATEYPDHSYGCTEPGRICCLPSCSQSSDGMPKRTCSPHCDYWLPKVLGDSAMHRIGEELFSRSCGSTHQRCCQFHCSMFGSCKETCDPLIEYAGDDENVCTDGDEGLTCCVSYYY